MKTKTAIISSLFLSFLTLGFSASAIGQADETATDSQKTVVTQESERETDSILASAVERFEVPDRDAPKDRLEFIKRELADLQRKTRRVLKHIVGTFWVDDRYRFIDGNDNVIGIWGVDQPQMIAPMRR